jgi:hypothetical protein
MGLKMLLYNFYNFLYYSHLIIAILKRITGIFSVLAITNNSGVRKYREIQSDNNII